MDYGMTEIARHPLWRIRPRPLGSGALSIAIPLLLGIILGANQLRAGAFLPWGLSIIYWTALSLAAWGILAATTSLLSRFLAPWNVSEWASWIGGAVIGSLVARPAIYIITNAFQPLMRNEVLRTMPEASLSWEFFVYFVTNWSVIMVLWVATCWLREQLPRRVLGYNTPEAVQPGEAKEEPDFLLRAALPDASSIIALKAEDHYTRIISAHGEKLVLEPFGKAIEQLDRAGHPGVRTHRSWWVACDQIEGLQTRGSTQFIALSNGMSVPVSRTYLESARELVEGMRKTTSK